MKTKFYFLTLAASVAFAACSNEELDNINNAGIQKAELVELDGVQVTVSKEGADSRINANGWESTDEVGVGFTNWVSASGSSTFSTNGGARETAYGSKWVNTSNDVLYANHRLFRTEGSWKFENVVYEGKHFAYYPLKGAHKTVEALTYELGTVQTFGEETDYQLNGQFAVTPSYDLVGAQSGKAPVVNFELYTITNRVKLNLEVANFGDIVDPIKVKSVTIKEASASSSFAQEVTLGEMPEAVYDAQNALPATPSAEAVATAQTADYDATETAFESGIIAALTYPSASDEMSTTVAGHTGFTTAAPSYAVNMFFFPIKTDVTDVDVIVETNYGTITIDGTTVAAAGLAKQIDEANKTEVTKLQNALKTTGAFGNFGKSATLTLKLNMANAVLPSVSASNDTEWADAVKIAGQKESVHTINVTGNVTADLTNLPENVTTIDVAATKTLTISGDVENDLTFTGSGALKVAAGTELNIKGEVLESTSVTLIGLDNYGTVTIDENSKVTAGVAINNHGEFTNNGTLTLNALFTNCKHVNTPVGHSCSGILNNNAAITGTASMLTNNATLYQGGTITTVTFNAPGVGSQAISINGAELYANSGASLIANVESTAQFDAALAAGASTINAKGVIALNSTLPARDIQLNLQNGAEFYIQENAANDGSKDICITAESGNCLIKSAASVYLAIKNLAVDANATLTIGSEDDTYAKKTAINVEQLSYPRGATIVNYGWIYAEKGSATNTGTWNGMDANKKETSATDATLTAISTAMSGR